MRSILNAAPVASRKSRFLIYLAVAILIAACTPLGKLIVHQGTAQLKPVEAPPPPQSPHVLIFALDGVGYDQFTEATRPGASPNVDALLGKATGGGGVFEAWLLDSQRGERAAVHHHRCLDGDFHRRASRV